MIRTMFLLVNISLKKLDASNSTALCAVALQIAHELSFGLFCVLGWCNCGMYNRV